MVSCFFPGSFGDNSDVLICFIIFISIRFQTFFRCSDFPKSSQIKAIPNQATIATATMDTMATMAEGVPAVLLPLAGMHLGYVPAIGGFQVPPVDR